MAVKIEESWRIQLESEFNKPYFQKLSTNVRTAYTNTTVFPPPRLVFNAFERCPFDQVKVVILGQDPYHGPSQAHGLCFSVQAGVVIPPSLQNIYKEIHADIGSPVPKTGDLTGWADQGVLLLNATLTVEKGRAGSHQGWGWEQFTDAVIQKISDEKEHVVFLLWGNYARSKKSLIDRSRHLVLEAPHPSPLSAHNGFFGCQHFSKTNTYLEAHDKKPIAW